MVAAARNTIGEEMLDVQQMAAELDVSSDTIYAECLSGKLPAIKVGRQWRCARSRFEQYKRGELDDAGQEKNPLPQRPRLASVPRIVKRPQG